MGREERDRAKAIFKREKERLEGIEKRERERERERDKILKRERERNI